MPDESLSFDMGVESCDGSLDRISWLKSRSRPAAGWKALSQFMMKASRVLGPGLDMVCKLRTTLLWYAASSARNAYGRLFSFFILDVSRDGKRLLDVISIIVKLAVGASVLALLESRQNLKIKLP